MKKSKSCQAVANMCVMLLYKDEQNGGPCRIFREYRYIPTTTSNNNHLPWLYYGEGDASILLNRKKIETHYSLHLEHKVMCAAVDYHISIAFTIVFFSITNQN